MNKKILLNKVLQENDIDSKFLISQMFLGYKYRKENHKLYSADINIPTNLIKIYYTLNKDEVTFDNMKKSFMNKYIKNESAIEGAHHNCDEVKGIEAMYEYINSNDCNYMFNVYTLKDLHKKLYSFVPCEEFGGNFRNSDCILNETMTEITPWSYIRQSLNEIDKNIQDLLIKASNIKNNDDVDDLLEYLDECVIIKCKLIQVHPFFDGNGRTIRGFINKLFELAGLPFVYIKENERDEYLKAMYKANHNDFEDIKNFYRYKICDSIVELDINNQIRNEKVKSLS